MTPGLQSGQVSLAITADDRAHCFCSMLRPICANKSSRCLNFTQRPAICATAPIAGVILTNAEVDAVAGLLSMREGHAFSIFGHQRVLDPLTLNPIFNVLNPARVPRFALTPGERFVPLLPDGTPSGLEVEAFEVAGKVAWYMEGVVGTARETPAIRWA
jgi:pyrroloquinoline quinone biosynthesis protein B